MAEDLNVVARLRFLAEGVDNLVNGFQRLRDGELDLEKGTDNLGKSGAGTAKDMRDLADAIEGAGKGAKDAGRDVNRAAEGWDSYRAAIDAARKAQKDFSQERVQAAFPSTDIPATSAQEMTSQQRRNLLAANDADTVSVISEARRIEAEQEKAAKNLDNIKRNSLANEFAEIQRIDAERKKNAEYLDALKRRSMAAELAETRRIAALRSEAQAGYAAQANAEAGDAYFNRVGLRAEDTTFVSDFNREAEKFAQQTSPRLRYALYDVSTTATITAAAITGVGVAVGVMAAQYESAFTNVERTLDNVDPSTVERLREELVGLTREIPLAFADVAEIATLGNQLGISANEISSFTETVARFSAVTGLSAEQTAQAFGSMDQILADVNGNYEALGSSIAYVARTTVATDAEILSLTREIGQQATSAGFAADEVIGLAGALASLRVPPERSRGALTTYFGTLNEAVAEGGERLELFSRIIGTTSDQLRQDVIDGKGAEIFERFALALSDLNNVEAQQALDGLGLSGLRVADTFTRVAQNVELYQSSLEGASAAYADGTELASQYALVVDDLASRWQIFLNSVSEAGAAVGAVLTPALKGALDALSNLFQGFARMSENPFGQGLIQASAVILGLVAGIAALIGVLALGAASFIAIRSAVADFGFVTLTTTTGVRGLTGQMLGLTTATGGAATAFRVMRGALISTGIGAAVVLVGSLAAALVEMGDAAEGAFDKFVGTNAGLAEALAADAQAYSEATGSAKDAFIELDQAAAESIPTFNEQAKAIQGAAIIAGADIPDAMNAASDAVERNTIVVGENTQAWLRNQLMSNDAFRELGSNEGLVNYFRETGASIDDLLAASLEDGRQGMIAYLKEIESSATAQAAIASGKIQSALREVNGETQLGVDVEWFPGITSGETASGLTQVLNILEGVSGQLYLTQVAGTDAGNAVADGANAASAALDAEALSAQDVTSALLEATSAGIQTQSAIYSLGAALGESGGAWSVFTEEGRGSMEALLQVINRIAAETPDSASATAANLQALFNMLVAGGYASAQQLTVLKGVIDNLSGGREVKAAQVDFASFFDGWQSGARKAAEATRRAAQETRNLREEVRTLVDYANDLQGIFSRSFDIRFGSLQAMDKVRSAWNAINQENQDSIDAMKRYRESIADSAAAIDELRREIAKLSSQRNSAQHFLGIAELYGDDLRADELRAEINDLNGSIADSQKSITEEQREAAEAQANLASEQEKATRSLKGNTDAAIANRSAILGLVSGYSSYLSALAASGASQETLRSEAARLKQEFINQATQAGFSGAEIARYASAFDDMTIAIDNVPRNVTVDANTNPAFQALNELQARLAAQASNRYSAGTLVPDINPTTWDLGGQAAGQQFVRGFRKPLDQAQIAIIGPTYDKIPDGGTFGFGVSGFSSGGYTGNVPTSQIAGVTHGQEFVMSAPAVRNAGGPEAMAFIHNMLKSGNGFPMIAGGGGGMTDQQIDKLARAIAYYNPGAVIPGVAIQRANAMTSAAANSQGRN